MGLAILVGSYTEELEHDQDAPCGIHDDMPALNAFLQSSGLNPHSEPHQCPVWSTHNGSYGNLHYLRRMAAHINLRGSLPGPGSKDTLDDPVIREYYALIDAPPIKLFDKLRGKRPLVRTFDHLMFHCDSNGFYLPQDFAHVLVTPDELKVPGGMIGSSHRLLHETCMLAQAIDLPLDLDPESKEVWAACVSQGNGEKLRQRYGKEVWAAWVSRGEGGKLWQRYGVESSTCLRLHCAAKHSIKHSAAIVFC